MAVDDVSTSRLRAAVTVDGILAHERVLQRIATHNGGTRASGTAGFEASATYVAARLRSAATRSPSRGSPPVLPRPRSRRVGAGLAGCGGLRDRHQPGRDTLLARTLAAPVADVPVIALSFADGAALYTAAQAGAGNPDKVVVVGAHLDSVIPGPGINDNGSGTSTILEIAEEMAELKIRRRQKVRFAFWGAEERPACWARPSTSTP